MQELQEVIQLNIENDQVLPGVEPLRLEDLHRRWSFNTVDGQSVQFSTYKLHGGSVALPDIRHSVLPRGGKKQYFYWEPLGHPFVAGHNYLRVVDVSSVTLSERVDPLDVRGCVFRLSGMELPAVLQSDGITVKVFRNSVLLLPGEIFFYNPQVTVYFKSGGGDPPSAYIKAHSCCNLTSRNIVNAMTHMGTVDHAVMLEGSNDVELLVTAEGFQHMRPHRVPTRLVTCLTADEPAPDEVWTPVSLHQWLNRCYVYTPADIFGNEICSSFIRWSKDDVKLIQLH